MPGKELLDPALQYGALGLCFALIMVLGWLGKRMLDVIDRNTAAFEKLASKEDRGLALLESLNAKLLARPCIARREEGGGL